MNIFRFFAVAFSMYSRIPMPRFTWKEDDMKYSLIFFPFIGIVIGALSYALWYVADMLKVPFMATVFVLGLIPLIVTGGFHVDGFMDVEDARRSYAAKEKKLEILKDPHIGAFAVVGIIKIVLIYGAGLVILVSKGSSLDILLYSITFVISRAVSGISARLLKKAKKDGMLYEETKGNGNIIIIMLLLQLVLAIGIMIYINPLPAIIILGAMAAVFVLYIIMSYKEFGGVTGDTAGYLVVNLETYMLAALSVFLLLSDYFMSK